MERVLYNTILGAWPIQPDGTSFYYSDYATTGKKVWYRDKWPCCSGTFPQLAADYHISTYLRSTDGVYVNLFTPSRVQWNDADGHYGLKQETQYPFDNKIQIQVSGSSSKEYNLYLRIPSWASPDPSALRQWQASCRSRTARELRRYPPHLERWRSSRVGITYAVCASNLWMPITLISSR